MKVTIDLNMKSLLQNCAQSRRDRALTCMEESCVLKKCKGSTKHLTTLGRIVLKLPSIKKLQSLLEDCDQSRRDRALACMKEIWFVKI